MRKTYLAFLLLSLFACTDISNLDPLLNGDIKIAPIENKEFAIPLFTGELSIADLLNDDDESFLNMNKDPWEFTYQGEEYNVLSAQEFADSFEAKSGVNLFRLDINQQSPADPNAPLNTYPAGTNDIDFGGSLVSNSFISPDTISLTSGDLIVSLKSKENAPINYDVSLVDESNTVLTSNSSSTSVLDEIIAVNMSLADVFLDFSNHTYKIRVSSTLNDGSDAHYYMTAFETANTDIDYIAFELLQLPAGDFTIPVQQGNVEIPLFEQTFKEGEVTFDSLYLASIMNSSMGINASMVFTELSAITDEGMSYDLNLSNSSISLPKGSLETIGSETLVFENAVDLINNSPSEIVYNGYVDIEIAVGDHIGLAKSANVTSILDAALPLTLAFKDVDFTSSASIGFNSDDNIDNVQEATLSLEVQNALPIAGSLQMGLSETKDSPNPYIVDLNGTEEGASVDFLKPLTDGDNGTTQVTMSLTQEDVKRILGSKYIHFIGTFNTPLENDIPQMVSFSTDGGFQILSGLKLKMSYDPNSSDE